MREPQGEERAVALLKYLSWRLQGCSLALPHLQTNLDRSRAYSPGRRHISSAGTRRVSPSARTQYSSIIRQMCSTLHSCSTMRPPPTSMPNARADGGSCVSCVGSGLGLFLLSVSKCRCGTSRMACSLCVWRRCAMSWRGCWFVIRADWRASVRFGTNRRCVPTRRLRCSRNQRQRRRLETNKKTQAILRAKLTNTFCVYTTTYPPMRATQIYRKIETIFHCKFGQRIIGIDASK